MKLFGSYTSPYVRHCRIALAQTGLDREFIETDYRQSAEQSPTQRVPFLEHGELRFTDSASILRYLRESAGQRFFPDVREFDQFLLATTALDSTVNLFLLERDGIGPDSAPYLERQQQRVDGTLTHLESLVADDVLIRGGDAALRLACYLSWGLFRERFSLSERPALREFLAEYDRDPEFDRTHPGNTNGN